MNKLFFVIAIIVSLSLKAQKTEFEISIGATLGKLQFTEARVSPDASILFPLLKEDRLTIYSGLRYDAIFYKRTYYPSLYYYNYNNGLRKTESKTNIHILALPLQLDIDLIENNELSMFLGISYKYIFGVVYKTTDTYEDGKTDKRVRSEFSQKKPSLSEFLADYQIGMRIKLFGNDKLSFNLVPLYQADVVFNEEENPTIVMHSFSLKISMNY